MAWSTSFLSKLGQHSLAPRVIVQTVRGPGSIGRGAWVLSNDPTIGQTAQLGGLSPIMGSRVSPWDWSAQPGGFSVTLIGDTSTLRKNLWRGQLVQVSIGWPGWLPEKFEAVALGQVWSARGRRDEMTIECRDMLGILGSRFTASSGEFALFHDAFTGTTVNGGTTTAGTTVVTVASTAGFTKQDDGSGALKGVIEIQSSNGTFYKTYTGKTATTFTGCSSSGVLGSTAVNFASGDVVREIPYADDHPIDFVRKTLASTGAGTNGSYDWYPAGSGFGFADWMLDHHDMSQYRLRSLPASGSGDWDFFSLTEQANAYQWIQQQIQPGGFFLAMRQGRITCRCALYLSDVGLITSASRNGPYNASGIEITDDDVASGQWPEWEAWDSSYQVEFGRLRVISAAGNTTVDEAVNTLPAEYRYEVQLGDRVSTNETNQRSLLRDRLKPWALRIPERLTIPYQGLRLAELAAGDAVQLTLATVGGRIDTTADGYRQRWAMVLGNDIDWLGGRGTVAVTIVPDKADDWG